MIHAHEIHLTELDVLRIERALTRLSETGTDRPQGVAELERLLDDAVVVPATTVDPEVVTMNSTVVLRAAQDGECTTLTLVYPGEADPKRARISVLSPMGRALIGARVGNRIMVATPSQAAREFTVVALTFQPEASGRFDL